MRCFSGFIFLILLLLLPQAGQARTRNIVMAEGSPPFYIEQKQSGPWIYMPYELYDADSYPYVDLDKLALARERFLEYAKIQKQAGYNSLVIGDISRLLSFEEIGLFAQDSREYERAFRYREFFKGLMEEADLNIFLSSDFQIDNPRLRDYVGPFSSDNKKLQEVNAMIFREIFNELPGASGVVMRVGEGGSHYSASEFYKSELLYKDADSLHRLLDSILPVFESHNKLLIFRTWTIGYGEIGDLMSNPRTYEEVFSPYYGSKNLVASIKYGNGDFWYFLKPNSTLGTGGLPQIVEFQLRREYEGYGTIANFIGPYYQEIIKSQSKNKNFAGVYAWPLMGGWDNAYNIPFFTDSGFWVELNNRVMAKLAANSDLDVKKEAEDFFMEKTNSASLSEKLADFAVNSPEYIKDVYYVRDYAAQDLSISQALAPKILWLSWDRILDDNFGMLYIVKNTSDIEGEVSRTVQAYKNFQKEKADILMAAARVNHNPEFINSLKKSLEYQDDLFGVLVDSKNMALYYYGYIDTGRKEYLKTAQDLSGKLFVAMHFFEDAYKDNPSFRSLDFANARDFVQTVQTHDSRRLINMMVSFAYLLIALSALFGWSGDGKKSLYAFIWGFFILSLGFIFSFSGFFKSIIFPAVIALIIVMTLFINQAAYSLFKIQAIKKNRTHSILMNIGTLSLFFFLLNALGLKFVPERLWSIVYDAVFLFSFKTIIYLFLFLLLYYIIKISVRRRVLKINKQDIVKIIVSDLITFTALNIIVWDLFIIFFPSVNQTFNLLPSIISDRGIGPHLVSQFRFLNLIMDYLVIFYIALPAFFANMAPVAAVRIKSLSKLAMPIHELWFGRNKTWRGLVVGTLVAAAVAGAQLFIFAPHLAGLADALAFGFLAGFGALAGDLFFSFIKRRLNIKSGRPFIPFDYIDYILGFLLFTSFVYSWSTKAILFLLVFAMIANPLTNVVSYFLGIKKTYW